MTEILSQIYNTLFNSIWIGILIFIYCHFTYKRNIDKLTDIMFDLNTKQRLLQQYISRVKHIVDVDNNTFKEQFQIIGEEIDKIKHEDGDEGVDENSTEDTVEKNILPIQNHIKYPDCWIFNEKNFKQIKLQNNHYELRVTGEDMRLISTQLAQFLKVKNGTCMEFNKAYEMVYYYIQKHNIMNISDDSKLCTLFGINENEDYEFTDETLIKSLKKMLEPHFRKIMYGQ